MPTSRAVRAATGAGGGAAALREGAALLAVVLTAAAVLGLFAVSPIALESWGIAYLSAGGELLAKMHPATVLAALALALRCTASRAPLRTAARLATGDGGVILLLGAVAVAAGFAAGVDRTPVTPLVDSFVLPVLVFLLLRDLDPVLLRRLAAAVALLLAVNSALAIAEFLLDWRLIPIDVPDSVTADPTRPDATFSWQAELAGNWRARALLGHPLVGGLITGEWVLCLVATAAPWPNAALRLALLGLAGAALFTFGSRAALVLAGAFALALVLWRAAAALARGARPRPRRLALLILGAGLLGAGAAALAASGFLDRTLERFSTDEGSAAARLTMFTLFEPMPWADLLLRPDKDLVATLQRLYGLEFGIESSWLGLALTYGLVVTALLVAGLAAFSVSVLRRCTGAAALVLAYYFVLISAAAALSGKTTTLAMTVALAMLFLRGDAAGFRRVAVV